LEPMPWPDAGHRQIPGHERVTESVESRRVRLPGDPKVSDKRRAVVLH
jgi:hypothetical protein